MPDSQVTQQIRLDELHERYRLRRDDPSWVAHLAELSGQLPAVTVAVRPEGGFVIVDGHARVAAARRCGQPDLPAEVVHGTDAELLAVAVNANACHGRPLTRAERLHAARALLESDPELSTRAVARMCGLGQGTVAAIRDASCPPAPAVHLDGRRTGLDGASYPIDWTAQRALIARLIGEDPEATDRGIARLAGCSPTTVGKVRRDRAPREGQPSPKAGHASPAWPSSGRRRPWTRVFWWFLRLLLPMRR